MLKLVAWAVGGFVAGVATTLGWQNRGKIINKAKETAAGIKDAAVNLVAAKEAKKDEPAIQSEPQG
jgi:hypothetical protein